MAQNPDHYTVLGVEPGAGHDEIRKAFRERVRACHPDRVAGLDEDLRRLAEQKMVELNEAYAVLRNPARRAAYDSRLSERPEAAAAAGRDNPAQPGAMTPHAVPRATHPADETRDRIGEQRFVARAASEEFQDTVRRCVPGQVAWTPLAFPGSTAALHGRRGRSNLYFVLVATPRLDDRRVRRFLRSLETFGDKLSSRLFGADRLFGFAGAVEFADPDRHRSALDRFNLDRTKRHIVQPATLIDLINWHVVPGEISLQERLEGLVRSG